MYRITQRLEVSPSFFFFFFRELLFYFQATNPTNAREGESDREAEISQIDAYDDDTYMSTMNEQLPVQQDWYGNQQQQG